MNYTDLKKLINMTDRQSVEAFIDGGYNDTKFEIRTENEATEAVYDMYRDDTYMLGMFNASFIADFICLDIESIELLQKAEGYEGLGSAIMNGELFEEMMDEYIRLDGYGHALSSYDGNYEEYSTSEGEDLIIVRVS